MMLGVKVNDYIASTCKVSGLFVSDGDVVNCGDDLFSVESQKMSTVIKANFEGKLISVNLVKGDDLVEGAFVLTVDGNVIEQSEDIVVEQI
ncbi:biotin/lipoyl-containing protein [Dehalobacter restrictus]|jgi:biotin carboxyl carrier protein|uniref:biotin/lipoyl-containing protein n=1 Tax=Dehalobacter restrictus TaxID=55583 RepID=UPI00338D5CD4